MSKNKGLFTDPFASINYFSRNEHYTALEHPFARLLRVDTLVYQSENSEVIDFVGTQMIYGYSFT